MMERKLYSLICIMIMGNICHAMPPSLTTFDNEVHVSDNKDRVKYAEQMMSFMNVSVEPCDDFYEYACGNWKNTIEEEQTEKKRSSATDIKFKLYDIVESILAMPHVNDVAPEYAEEFQLAKKFYNQCLEADLYPMKQSAEYLEIIRNVGGFPALDPNWNDAQFSWINMSAHLNLYGVKSLIKELIFDEYPFFPFFTVPSFGFDIELHHDTIENVSSIEYQMNSKRMHELLSLYDVAEDKSSHIIEQVFAFLKDVLKIAEKCENQYECQMLAVSLEDSAKDELKQHWLQYLDIVWMGNFKTFNADERILSYFYHELNKTIEAHKEAAANYLSLKFLYHMDARLHDSKLQKDYCRTSLRKPMEFLIDHIYMKIYFDKDLADDTNEIAKQLKQSLRIVLQNAEWLDESSREAALLKESTMTLTVGRFEDPETSNRLLNEIQNLSFIDASYQTNYANLMKFKNYMARYYGTHGSDFSYSTKPTNLLLGMNPNAFYSPSDNGLFIPAGVLQPPEFHKKWPISLKYGTLGFVMAHEYSHAFDTLGVRYDHAGERNHCWSKETKEVFAEHVQCFVDFYSNYTVAEINRPINGDATKDENIADAGALRLAMMSYRRYVDDRIKDFESESEFYKDEQMPGLDLSAEQLFFLGAAQLWCSSFKQENYWQELKDDHTIDKYRVLGMFANNDDFSQAYNCPRGSKMNAARDKCKIW